MPRWNSCNVLQIAPDASRLWQFDAKGGNFVLSREQKTADGAPLPSRYVAKSWSSLWQPKLNVAWLPPEEIFLRVVELPKSSFDETRGMVELQLEKLSPMPVGQIVWTIHILPSASADLQSVIVTIANRVAVEEFLGKIEARGFLTDRLETPLLDQLSATPPTSDGAWIYVGTRGQNSALVAWWFGGALRNLSFIVLPTSGDSAKSLREQLSHLAWAGELEGWLTAQPTWHLVADPVNAAQWENFLREALNEPVQLSEPLPAVELAAHTARRAAAAPDAGLLPPEFPSRYREQFHDRLWLHGLYTAGIVYAICVAFYFALTTWKGYQTRDVEQRAATLGQSYTNVMELQARYQVLKERDQLKYAALDCWKIVAEQLPDDLPLQHFVFSGGQKLTLSGVASQSQFDTVLNFNKALKKAQVNGKPMFSLKGGEDVSPRIVGDNLNWSFTLQLANSEPETGGRVR
ncbi:MAG TPA: hypothetical protein VN516_03385 [Candidatus Baltobacteraceae bacterium]|nr:hypothetical protein [Candidatus Baltobacteraceae bacterium]